MPARNTCQFSQRLLKGATVVFFLQQCSTQAAQRGFGDMETDPFIKWLFNSPVHTHQCVCTTAIIYNGYLLVSGIVCQYEPRNETLILNLAGDNKAVALWNSSQENDRDKCRIEDNGKRYFSWIVCQEHRTDNITIINFALGINTARTIPSEDWKCDATVGSNDKGPVWTGPLCDKGSRWIQFNKSLLMKYVTTQPTTYPDFLHSSCESLIIQRCYGYIIGLVVAVILAIIGCILVIICRNKGSKELGNCCTAGRTRGFRVYLYDGRTSSTMPTEHHNDADAFHLVDRHAQASVFAASHEGRAPSTSDAPAQDRHYTEDIRKPNRLLVAAEGVVSQLSVRALHSTAIVEYSDRSCSLNDILEKAEQAVERSPMKFKSVALLLRPANVGVILSEVDQAVLNYSSIQDQNGEKLRAFIARLAKICLDECGGTRMDILNYNGEAPLRLGEALTKFLGVPTTVSKDQFGVATPTNEKGGHAVVADTYFDRNNVGEVVYAELQLPSVKPQTQPRPAEEGVTYSEIRR